MPPGIWRFIRRNSGGISGANNRWLKVDLLVIVAVSRTFILKQNIISVGLIHVHQVALPPSSTSTKWHFHEALVRMVPYVKFVPNLRQALVRCEVRFSISSFFEPPIYHVGEDSCRTWKSHSRISSNKHQQPKGLDTRTSTGHGSKTPYISCFPVELPATQHFEAGEPLWAWVKIKPPEKTAGFGPCVGFHFAAPPPFVQPKPSRSDRSKPRRPCRPSRWSSCASAQPRWCCCRCW